MSSGVPPPRQISAVLERLRALTRPDSNFEARVRPHPVFEQHHSTIALQAMNAHVLNITAHDCTYTALRAHKQSRARVLLPVLNPGNTAPANRYDMCTASSTCHPAVSGIDRMFASIFCLQLARDSQYYSAVVLEEEGTVCAVVLASKLSQVRLSLTSNPFCTTGPEHQFSTTIELLMLLRGYKYPLATFIDPSQPMDCRENNFSPSLLVFSPPFTWTQVSALRW